MTVIQPDIRLYDAHGHQWRTAPDFQDREVNAPGWLLLQRMADGVEMPYTRVLEVFGYGSGERRYLLGRFDQRARLAAQNDTEVTCLGRDMDCGRPLPCPDHPAAQNDTEVS